MPDLQITSGKFESYAHKLLWEGSSRHLELAKHNLDDSWFLHLSAGLLAAASFEAYLNYVGEEILPEIWKNEKAFFSQAEYKGTEGKLKRIAEEISWKYPSKNEQPLAGVIQLLSFRNKLVHGRTERNEKYQHVHRKEVQPSMPPHWMQHEGSPASMQKSINCVCQFAELLHKKLLESDFRFCIKDSHPLMGMLGWGAFVTNKHN